MYFIHIDARRIYLQLFIYSYNNKKIYVIFVITAIREDLIKLKHFMIICII